MTSVDKITEIFWTVDKFFKNLDAGQQENHLAASLWRQRVLGKQGMARSCSGFIFCSVPPRPEESVSSKRAQFPNHTHDARHKERPEEALLAFTGLAGEVHLPGAAEDDHIAVVARSDVPVC